MTSQILCLNIAIKNGKQPNNSISVEDRKHTRKELSPTFQIKKAAKLVKQPHIH